MPIIKKVSPDHGEPGSRREPMASLTPHTPEHEVKSERQWWALQNRLGNIWSQIAVAPIGAGLIEIGDKNYGLAAIYLLIGLFLAFVVSNLMKDEEIKRTLPSPTRAYRYVGIAAVTITWALFVGDIYLRVYPPSATTIQAAKSRWLKLDDATKWQFVKSLQDAAKAANGDRAKCVVTVNLSANSDSAMNVWSELEPLLYYAGWNLGGGDTQRVRYPLGVTISVGVDHGDIYTCASALAIVLKNTNILPTTIRANESTPNLVACKNECFEIDVGDAPTS